MIAKGNPHNSGPYLARYLAASSKGNERAELAELRGFASDNIFDAFALAQLQAEGTHCQKPLFHVQVRMPQGEELNRDQWAHVADRIERALDFDGQPRAVVFHQKDGQDHMHLVWSRIDAETMHAIDPGLYKRKLKEVCRKLEKEMGLQQVRNEREPGEKTQAAARPEFEQSRRLKTDVKAIREGIRDCWDESTDGAGFVAALEMEGLILAKGDKRSFVVVDERGGYHALGKRITGATAEQTRARLADLKAASLPTVEAAQAMQRERREQEKGAMSEQKEMTDEDRRREAIQKEEEARREAIQKEEAQRQEAIKAEEDRRQQAIAEEEAKRQEGMREEEKRKDAARQEEENRQAFAAEEARRQDQAREEEARQQAIYKELVERQIEQVREMAAQEERLAAYRAELARRAEESRHDAERRKMEAARSLEIRNASYRYGEALGRHYDIKDHYGSLSRAAMEEYRTFLQERENLNRQIAQAKDPKELESLELRKRIESAEYMALTSDRIAAQSEIIVGRLNTDEAKHRRELGGAYRHEAKELRAKFNVLQAERSQEAHEKIYGKNQDKAQGSSERRGHRPNYQVLKEETPQKPEGREGKRTGRQGSQTERQGGRSRTGRGRDDDGGGRERERER